MRSWKDNVRTVVCQDLKTNGFGPHPTGRQIANQPRAYLRKITAEELVGDDVTAFVGINVTVNGRTTVCKTRHYLLYGSTPSEFPMT